MSASVSTALDRARAFVAKHGSPLERELLVTLLGECAPDVLLAEIAARQDDRGAIAPLLADGRADVFSTGEALQWLDAMGRLDSRVAEAAAAFLAAEQREDGSWGARPDADAGERLVLTGALCGALARSRVVRPSLLSRACAFVEAAWSVEAVQGGELAPITAFFRVFSQLPSEPGDEALQWCGRELERGFRTGRFGALQAARVFVGCQVQALPGCRLGAGEVVAALLAAQDEDGGWTDGASAARVLASCEAARALRLLAPGEGAPC